MLQTTTLAQSARLGVRTLTAGRRSYVTAQTAVGGASSQPLHSAPGAPIPAKKLESLGSVSVCHAGPAGRARAACVGLSLLSRMNEIGLSHQDMTAAPRQLLDLSQHYYWTKDIADSLCL